MLKQNRIERAQSAYNRKDVEATKAAHTKEAIVAADEEHQKERGKYIGDLVFGALDGIITTFAVVSGVEGAKLSSTIVLILGFANLLGDGISMAVGNYLSTKSECEYMKRERNRELWEIEHYPEGEREEIRHIFKKKGFKGKDLDRAVEIITSNKEVWVKTMMLEELGLTQADKTPFMSGAATFVAFVLAGVIPLLAFVAAIIIPGLDGNLFLVSTILTGIALFAVGSLRSLVTDVNWIRGGFEMLFVGGVAASVAYIVGSLLSTLV